MKTKCSIISGVLSSNNRESNDKKMIFKKSNSIEIVYNQDDSLDSFEYFLNELSGNSSSFYNIKKKLSTYLLSLFSVIVILFALISSSLYEDIMKKLIFEFPFEWKINDSVSMLFVLLFFFGLVLMPSILDGEGSEFKESLKAWFNKDIRVLKRLRASLHSFDKKTVVNIYNIDFLEKNHWIWRLVIPILLNHFININIYTRRDLKKRVEKKLKELGCLNISLQTKDEENIIFKNYEKIFSMEEEILYTLMQLSSTNILNKNEDKVFISLELFEYCGRNFYDNKSEKNQLISGFQNFINRCFDDFKLLEQHNSNQISFSKNMKIKDLEEERRRLSFYLRNHIEECLEYFDNPVSFLILYYYVKDIILDEKRTISILEKFIESIKNKQQYHMINNYWFHMAGLMFDSKDLSSFINSSDSIYRKLSIKSLNSLVFLFERNGKFEQALLLCHYLYEINPNKYSIDISSLYERIGEFDKAYKSLVHTPKIRNKPSDIEVKFYQRKAWIIVSKRDEDKKEEGLIALNELEKLLISHQDFNDSLWLWHFYNIKANYKEWDEDYSEAISNYMKCLSIPALGAFEYGATFINMSIAYRFKFFEELEKDIELIDKSIYLGNIGKTLKESVGDRDEMPVVLHNQSLNILYKLAFFDDENLVKKVIILSQLAFEILDETKSKKRLGMILTELIIAKSLLKEKCDFETNLLKEHWQNMDLYEKKQAVNIYEIFSKKLITNELNWMD